MFDRRRRQSFQDRLEALARRLDGLQRPVEERERSVRDLLFGERDAQPERERPAHHDSSHEQAAGARHVLVPEVEGGGEVVVVDRWMVAPGDRVAKGDPLVHLVYAPWTLEIPSPADGRVERLLVLPGVELKVGEAFLLLRLDESPAATTAASTSATPTGTTPSSASTSQPTGSAATSAATGSASRPTTAGREDPRTKASARPATPTGTSAGGKTRPNPPTGSAPQERTTPGQSSSAAGRHTAPVRSEPPSPAAPPSSQVDDARRTTASDLSDLLERTRVPLPGAQDGPMDGPTPAATPATPSPTPPAAGTAWDRDQVQLEMERRAGELTPEARRHLDRFRGLPRPVAGDEQVWVVAQCGVALLLLDTRDGTFSTGRLWQGAVEEHSHEGFGRDLGKALAAFPPGMGLRP